MMQRVKVLEKSRNFSPVYDMWIIINSKIPLISSVLPGFIEYFRHEIWF